MSSGFRAALGAVRRKPAANPQQWTDAILPETAGACWPLRHADGCRPEHQHRISNHPVRRRDIRWVHVGFQVRDAAGELVRLTGISRTSPNASWPR